MYEVKKLLAIVILILIFGLCWFAFKKSPVSNENNKVQVTASFYPMYFFGKSIAGDKINITNITPAGVEPHDYDLTPQDIIKIELSKLLILNGNVEPWQNKIETDLKNKDTKILVVGENLTSSVDPHVWLSPTLAKIESQKITQGLIDIDPVNSDYYKNNLMNLLNQLNKIDNAYKTGLANCQTKSFVTSHAAFGYLAKDYGLNQIAIDGLSPDTEPSLAELAKITDFVKKNNVKVIFFEKLVSPKLSETIANEAGAKTLILDPIEGGSDYLTAMANNLQNLRIAMECK